MVKRHHMLFACFEWRKAWQAKVMIIQQRFAALFCGKTEKQVRKLIAGPGDVFICDECISLCDEILEDELQELYSDRDAEEEVEINLLKPKEIKEFLDEYVIGQEEAKKHCL